MIAKYVNGAVVQILTVFALVYRVAFQTVV